MSLRDAVHALQSACFVRGASAGAPKGLRLEDEGTVGFTIELPSGSTSVSVTFRNYLDYPKSGVFITADATDNNSAHEALHALSQSQFAEHAPLEKVVAEVGGPEGAAGAPERCEFGTPPPGVKGQAAWSGTQSPVPRVRRSCTHAQCAAGAGVGGIGAPACFACMPCAHDGHACAAESMVT
jgi:hypothetical protein